MKKFTAIQGSYRNTTDDRLGRWYIHRIGDTVLDKRGPGFRTKKEALEAARRDMGAA